MIFLDGWFLAMWFIASALMYRSLRKRVIDEVSFFIVMLMSTFWPATLVVAAWRKLAGA